MTETPWHLLPIPAADNTPPCNLTGDVPDMLDSARAGEPTFMAQPVAAVVAVDNDWKNEARGIPPWPGAHVHHCLLGDDRTDIVTWLVDKPGFENWRVESYVTCFHLDTFGGSWADVPMVLALDNPDTCAAFLRRLAVRLGTPEGQAEKVTLAVAEGVRFYWDDANGGWTLEAGYYYQWYQTFTPEQGFPTGSDGEIGDMRLLALVRAWRSVDDG